jgi:YesN/AraC family two-component response regulator
MGRKKLTQTEKIKYLVLTYGTELRDDIFCLALDKDITLQSVADKYGVSREYVRQLFEIYWDEPYTEYLKRKRISPARCFAKDIGISAYNKCLTA